MDKISTALKLTFVVLSLLLQSGNLFAIDKNSDVKPVLVIHGGAGTITKSKLSDKKEREIHSAMRKALQQGYAVLMDGGHATDAVGATITSLEDSPLFNAGKGAVFTHEGKNELDASIMEGATLNAGAVAGVTRIKNPIVLAAKVMTDSKHVLMARDGAEMFAKHMGITMVEPSYFHTKERWRQLQKKLVQEKKNSNAKNRYTPFSYEGRFGTVGAVALDRSGTIAAGTSTGGMTNKHYGRVGDSPLIGAGTYADNTACGISATGHGEYFIRASVAHDICVRSKYKKISLQKAADEVIQNKLVEMGGAGGIVGLDPKGNIVISFNTEGMYRGSINASSQVNTQIFK